MIQFYKQRPPAGWTAEKCKMLIELAEDRISHGLAPPPEIYRIEYRQRIDWSEFPSWAQPIDPEIFDRCCHEG
jgi:hypothetical protein